jgi:thioesterase domain-containing protein
MPSIMIIADVADRGDAEVFLAERLMSVQLDDAHFAAQLVERLKWASEDAERQAAELVSSSTSSRQAAVVARVADQAP